MVDNKRIAKNTIFLYFRMFLIMGVSLYTSRVILKTLGVVDYGLYNVVGGLVTMISCLGGSLGGATSRYITFELGKQNYVQLKKIFSVAFAVHVFMALIIVLLAETIGLWFFYHKMEIPVDRFSASFWVYQISLITMFMNLTQVPYNATIIAHENMKIYAYVGMAEVMARLAVVYMISISPFDRLVFYAMLLCLVQVCVMAFYRFYCTHHYEESHLTLCGERKLYKDIFTYAGSDFIGSLSVMAQGQGLNVLLNMFFGPVVNAARGVAYQVQAAVTQFSNNFMTAVRPQLIKSYAEGNAEAMWKLVKQSSCFSFYLMWMLCLPIMLETDTILHIWLGKYPAHTVNFLILVLILCLMQTLKTPRNMVFHAMAKVFWINISGGIIHCSAFPLAYLFLKLGYAPESVFQAALLTYIISECVGIYILRLWLKFSVLEYLLSVHVRCLLVVGVSFLMSHMICNNIMEPSFLRLCITCVVTTASVAVTALYLGMDKEMRIRIYKITRHKLFHHK